MYPPFKGVVITGHKRTLAKVAPAPKAAPKALLWSGDHDIHKYQYQHHHKYQHQHKYQYHPVPAPPQVPVPAPQVPVPAQVPVPSPPQVPVPAPPQVPAQVPVPAPAQVPVPAQVPPPPRRRAAVARHLMYDFHFRLMCNFRPLRRKTSSLMSVIWMSAVAYSRALATLSS